MSRVSELRAECERHGFTVRTYSPGDGVTRYRFSAIDDRSGDYFSMRKEYTARGLKEATAYAQGRIDGAVGETALWIKEKEGAGHEG